MGFATSSLSMKERSVATSLGMADGELQSLKGLVERIGITTVSTSYSGIDAPGTSMLMMLASLEHIFGIPTKHQHPHHLWSVEWEPSCRKELQAHPCKSDCLFGDISEFLPKHVRSQMQSLHATDKLYSVFMPFLRDNACKAVQLLLD